MSRCAESRVGAAGGQPGERTYVHMTSHHDCFSLFPAGWWTLWGPGSQLQPLPPALVTPRTSHQAHRLRAPTRRSWGRPGSERQGGGAAGLEQGLPPLRSPAPPPPGPYRNTGTPVRRGPPEGRRGQRRGGEVSGGPAPPPRPRPAPALPPPPPASSGSRRSPPRRAPPHAPPALRRRAPRRSALPEAAGSAGGCRAPPAAQRLGTPPPRRPPPTRAAPRAPAGSACDQPQTWVKGTGLLDEPRARPGPHHPPAVSGRPLPDTCDPAPCSDHASQGPPTPRTPRTSAPGPTLTRQTPAPHPSLRAPVAPLPPIRAEVTPPAPTSRRTLPLPPPGTSPAAAASHLPLRRCGLPRQRNRPFTTTARRVQSASHSSMLRGERRAPAGLNRSAPRGPGPSPPGPDHYHPGHFLPGPDRSGPAAGTPAGPASSLPGQDHPCPETLRSDSPSPAACPPNTPPRASGARRTCAR